MIINQTTKHLVKRNQHLALLFSFIMIPAVLLLVPTGSPAADQAPGKVGKAVSVQGNVEIQQAHNPGWLPLKTDTFLYPGDIVRVLENSRAAVLLENQTVLRLDQNTTITFSSPLAGESSWIEMVTGAVHFLSLLPCRLKVITPFVNGEVEGTEFMVRVEEQQALFHLFQGQVLLANGRGRLLLAAGQSAVAGENQSPALTALEIRPRDAVRWTLYYPLIFDYQPEDFPAGDGRATLERSLAFFQQGGIVQALKELDLLPEASRSKAPIPVYEAGLLLTVGRVDAAQAVIDRSLAVSQANDEALALSAIIAVVQNRKEKALELARQAVALNPAAAGPRLALSYAYQAGFDIEAARESSQEAVAREPDNAVALARLAELWLATGHLDEALAAAGQAVATNPHLSHTQTVLGFAHLTRIETDKAKECFRLAIELDQAAPLPHLGLGLALIREGDLAAGREQIEIAVALDPDNSLIRSYLGKAYFEEYKDRPAGNQFAMAKELDPLDPSPWFYDALRKQSLNMPVEALHDLQKSMELNDNRAVYRSRLLLDEDQAARSASLARIYDDLGFSQLALVEGWKSVNTDPANYSAHRFLADSYAALPRHEIARVSELLQSQLLQPLNITPLQPSLASSNLFILEGAGPSDPSFNEFNSLFLRNRVAMQTSGVWGQNNTIGDEVVLSAVQNKVSLSAGQFYYQTDGFRENNDLTERIGNAFAQFSLTPKTSVQMEYRTEKLESGYLDQRFVLDPYYSTYRNEQQPDLFRFGLHHAITPQADLLASVSYQGLNDDSSLMNPPMSFNKTLYDSFFQLGYTLETYSDGYLAETQYLFHSTWLNIILGAGHYSADKIADTNTLFLYNFSTPSVSFNGSIPGSYPTEKHQTEHSNIYLYSLVSNLSNCTWTIGASVDQFKGGTYELDIIQLNPKWGITWNPLPNTTLRTSIFRVLKRSLLTNQTIEPTQVSGFNQFFDDYNGTESWIYGVALDQKIVSNLFVGAEYYARDLSMHIKNENTSEIEQDEADDKQGRAYFYWAPHPWYSLSIESFYEALEGDAVEELYGCSQITTYRLPLGITLFHPLGFFAKFRAAYVDQKVVLVDSEGTYTGTDSDTFWELDLSLGYRLPHRRGIISIEGRNILDTTFQYQSTDPAIPTVPIGQMILAKATLLF